ncbi:MAG TPA: hypothetical protein VFI24_04500 [Pyrinomonadaceae bacterium]|nr:hypothetical protein [Pyrinomonadaceae bacterium]
MKTLLLTVIVAIGLVSLSCGVTKSQTNSESPREQTPVTKQTVIVMPPSANADEYKDLLFVDQSLEELITRYNAPSDPFAKAYQHVKEGKTDDAKKSLRQVLSDPKAEVREKLWAWRALRQSGDKPPPNVANEIQGVVMEVPVNDWIDTLAAYSDGRARYLNPKGGLIVWEAMEENRLSTLAKNFINAAKPLIERAPISDKHQPAKNGVVRVSILTYAGIHILEGKDSEVIEGRHILSPAAFAGQELFLALLEVAEKQKR